MIQSAVTVCRSRFFLRRSIFTIMIMLGTTMNNVANAADSPNVTVLKQLYAAFGKGDLETITGLMSDQIEWIHPGPSVIPFAGTFKGHEGVHRFFEIAGERILVQEQKLLNFLERENQVAVLGYERMQVKATGKVYQSNWVHLYTLQEGRIVRFEEFIDTAALTEAFSAN